MRLITMMAVLLVSGVASVQGQDCYSFVGGTVKCWTENHPITEKYCEGECWEGGQFGCKSGVNFQEQHNTTTEWDDIVLVPAGDAGYRSWSSFEVWCTYTADCKCIESSQSSTGLNCVADLLTEDWEIENVPEVDINDPCTQE